MDEMSVYELDIDGLIADVRELLGERGFEVTEQMPEGVWWFRTSGDSGAVRRRIAGAFAEVAERRLRQVSE